MINEMTGPWEELISRPEFRGHQVRITIVDQTPTEANSDVWLESLLQLARGGVRVDRPADDSRESIY